jgi:hypothetical protein
VNVAIDVKITKECKNIAASIVVEKRESFCGARELEYMFKASSQVMSSMMTTVAQTLVKSIVPPKRPRPIVGWVVTSGKNGDRDSLQHCFFEQV